MYHHVIAVCLPPILSRWVPSGSARARPAVGAWLSARADWEQRWPQTKQQTRELANEFLFNEYLAPQRRLQINTDAELTDRQVKIWIPEPDDEDKDVAGKLGRAVP